MVYSVVVKMTRADYDAILETGPANAIVNASTRSLIDGRAYGFPYVQGNIIDLVLSADATIRRSGFRRFHSICVLNPWSLPKAYATIGAPGLGECVHLANELWRNSDAPGPISSNPCRPGVDTLVPNDIAISFHELDNRYRSSEERLIELLATYVRKHPNEFGPGSQDALSDVRKAFAEIGPRSAFRCPDCDGDVNKFIPESHNTADPITAPPGPPSFRCTSKNCSWHGEDPIGSPERFTRLQKLLP